MGVPSKKVSEETSTLIKERFTYDPNTGVFYWKVDVGTRARRGGVAGTYCKGYLYLKVNKEKFSAHRVAYYLMTGVWTELQIDHINQDRGDNRWCNLRAVTNTMNTQNSSMNKNNTSGTTGVCWDSSRQRWIVQISFKGKRMCLGCYKCKELAVFVRQEAERQFDYGVNHGAPKKHTYKR